MFIKKLNESKGPVYKRG